MEINNSAAYDTCGKGKSALLAALLRNLTAEVATLIGDHAVTMFNDFQKLFDNIDLVVLMQEAVHLNVPLGEFLIGLQQHSAPRVLQCAGFSGTPASIYESILPGCKKAVTFIKILLKRSILDIHNHEASIYIHVDDISIQAKRRF